MPHSIMSDRKCNHFYPFLYKKETPTKIRKPLKYVY